MSVTEMPFLTRVPGVDPGPDLEPARLAGAAGATFALQIDITGLPAEQQLRLQALAWALQLEAARAPVAGLQPGRAVLTDAADYAAYLTTGTTPPN